MLAAFWKAVDDLKKEIIATKKQASCQKNIEPNQIYNANSINDFFIKIDSNLTKHLKKNLRPRLKSNAHSLFLHKTILSVNSKNQKIFQGLDNKSSSGDDNLINVLFKTSVSVTAVYLKYIINFSFSTVVSPMHYRTLMLSLFMKNAPNLTKTLGNYPL